jgi:hypothetical protein
MQVAALRENSDYFRRGLMDLGCNVLGEWGSPVMVRAQAALVGQHCPLLAWHMSLWMVLPLHISARVWCTWMGRGVDTPQATQQAEARLAQAWRGVGFVIPALLLANWAA